MMKTVLIAGGNSFIARHLISLLDAKSYNVIALTHSGNTPQISHNISYVNLSFNDYPNINKYIKHCDIYIPFAWAGTDRNERTSENINEFSCRMVLQSIKVLVEQCGCKKIILPGTCHEYCNSGSPIDENTPCIPSSPYGKYKNLLVNEAKEYCNKHNVKLITLRMFSIYGADDNPNKMINVFVKKLLSNELLEMTYGYQIWSFLHVDDVAAAFKIALDNDIPNGVYNLGATEHRRLRDFVDEIKNISESKSDIVYGAIPYNMDVAPHTIFISNKSKEVLGWFPKITFSNGILQMIEYYRNR